MKRIYKIFRAVIVSSIMTVIGLYLLMYIAVSVPFVQNYVKDIACQYVSSFLGAEVKVGSLKISPFNQIVLSDLTLYDTDGSEVINIEKVGAGISIWKLLYVGRLEFSFAEIIGLDAKIIQKEENAPLNIQFLIDAFKPKDPTKPPAKFNLIIRNIVLRKCSGSYDKSWKQYISNGFDPNHISISNLTGDIIIPVLKNDDIIIDLRRLSFREKSGFEMKSLSGTLKIDSEKLSMSDLCVELSKTKLCLTDIVFPIKESNKSASAPWQLKLENGQITPSDLSCFYSALERFNSALIINVNASGDKENLNIERFSISSIANGLNIALSGAIRNFLDKNDIKGELTFLNIDLNNGNLSNILSLFIPDNVKFKNLLSNIGDLSIDMSGRGDLSNIEANGILRTSLGAMDLEVLAAIGDKNHIIADISTPGFNIGQLVANPEIGDIRAHISADVNLNSHDLSGFGNIDIGNIEYNGTVISDIRATVVKNGNVVDLAVNIDDESVSFDSDIKYTIGGADSHMVMSTDVKRFIPSKFGFLPQYKNYVLKFNALADISGNNIDNIIGYAKLSDFSFANNHDNNKIELQSIVIESSIDNGEKSLTLESDMIDAGIYGRINFSTLPSSFRSIVGNLLQDENHKSIYKQEDNQSFKFNANLKVNNVLTDFLKLPVRLVHDIVLDGEFDSAKGLAEFNVDAPFIQQGKDKLIRGTRFNLSIDSIRNIYTSNLYTILPGKNGDVSVGLKSYIENFGINTDISWIYDREKLFKGQVSFRTELNKKSSGIDLSVNVQPSEFIVNDILWHINPAHIGYSDNILTVDGVNVYSNDQFVSVNGIGSVRDNDSIVVTLQDMNLDYLFETLAINYVTFGGNATGKINLSSLFSKHPNLSTNELYVKSLSYNGSVLGDALLKSRWLNNQKKVEIDADIHEGNISNTTINGGIWVTKDSLSFECNTSKVNIGFLKPFVEGFTSDIRGRASGNVKLYGTFKDIDLIGDVFADSIAMKVDYTNTWYHGSDSVYMRPGLIEIRDFTLYDREQNTAKLNGFVSHKYFREPKFDFKITDAQDFLSYDTNSQLNPDWYGTIYGNGGCTITGRPGVVNILVDMTTRPKSSFTFVLNDTEAASDYTFLSFSDRRKEARENLNKKSSIPDFVENFRKKIEPDIKLPSKFAMDLRITATPDLSMTLVMDPIGGDKIKGNGSGALQIGYDSDSDEMTMYGKYSINQGLYNFTLQDIILKDFTIRPESNISFNGDPFAASIDIKAVYRVNTSLTDLDKSFSTDRDLNRTNVPVEAVLMVNGNMQSPEINFDIELPTLTQDVERKVKSIISTEDMMSKQVLYLLALNRFYTPEYMGGGGNNNELASVASSTISSQLSNILSQISDKWKLSPYFRTDKGDFSDIEVDVALSSALLNNRLLLNGNFGYRDRATSSTTFVGDFDIEYLLNRQGTLRLKAYNHYNDQNYYLKSALTTQGIGVILKHDFDRWFNFLRRKKNNKLIPKDKELKEQ